MWLALVAIACAQAPTPKEDAGAEQDAGSVPDAGAVPDAGWTALWNGVDFDGWDTWLGSGTPGQPVPGLNADQRGVFTVVQKDGEPAIRVSGEIWGALI